MINLIVYQRGKDVKEIMFQMSEKKTRDAFRNKETAIKYFFFSVFAFVFVLHGITVYSYIVKFIFH
jgi:NADH:ubiquinone oxidoreductase subunit 2 (subunit N)